MDGAISVQSDHLKKAEEEGDGTEDTSGTGDLESTGSALRVTASAAAAAAAGTLGVALGLVRASALGVSLLATASVDTLDDGVVLVLLESLACIVNVLL